MTKATDLREQTLIKKYGSKEALAEKRKEWQAKSRLKYKGTGGFAYLKKVNPEKLKEISTHANRKSQQAKKSKLV